MDVGTYSARRLSKENSTPKYRPSVFSNKDSEPLQWGDRHLRRGHSSPLYPSAASEFSTRLPRLKNTSGNRLKKRVIYAEVPLAEIFVSRTAAGVPET